MTGSTRAVLSGPGPVENLAVVERPVRELFPEGVDAALELVGTPTLPDTPAATRVHGTSWSSRKVFPESCRCGRPPFV